MTWHLSTEAPVCQLGQVAASLSEEYVKPTTVPVCQLKEVFATATFQVLQCEIIRRTFCAPWPTVHTSSHLRNILDRRYFVFQTCNDISLQLHRLCVSALLTHESLAAVEVVEV